jgi:hypothetical protein
MLAVCRVDPQRAVALLGHTYARVTIGVHTRAGDVELLERILGCTPRDEARAIFEDEDVLCRSLRASDPNEESRTPSLAL